MERRPRLLDLFCGAGGAGMGYHRAGFEVVGVDIKPQPRYPFEFHQADALEYVREHGHEFDAIHASPPCQFGSTRTPATHRHKHRNLIPATRSALRLAAKPYVIENVAGSRFHLVEPLMLCGSMFRLSVWRHRYFEVVPALPVLLPPCSHHYQPVAINGTRSVENAHGKNPSIESKRVAMGIDWMTHDEIDQAIPPAYTELIGLQLIQICQIAHSGA